MKMSYLLASLFVAIAGLTVATPAVRADNSQLAVTQDESSMEKVIESYLKDQHNLIIDEVEINNDPNDLGLKIPFKAENGVPKFNFYIDTQPTGHNDQDQVTERGVLFSLETGVIVPEAKRADIYPILNDYNRRKNFSSIYIDTNGQIKCDWIINVMSQGMPTEYVFDALVRIQNLWRGLWPEISQAFDNN